MRKLLLGMALGFGLAALVTSLSNPPVHLAPVGISYPYSRFVTDVDDGKVEEVTIQGPGTQDRRQVQGPARVRDFGAARPGLASLTDRLLANKVMVTARPTEDDPSATSALVAWTPVLICYGIFFGSLWLFMTRPVLALIRQLGAYTKAAQHATAEPPAHDSRSRG